MATTEGSANDLLWEKFEQKGWLTRTEIPGITVGQPKGVPRGKVYSVRAEGTQQMAALLAARDALVSERQKKSAALGKFHDERGRAFISEMRAVVKAAGGSSFDVGVLGGLLLKTIVQAIAEKGFETKVLEDITGTARELLAKEAQASSTS